MWLSCCSLCSLFRLVEHRPFQPEPLEELIGGLTSSLFHHTKVEQGGLTLESSDLCPMRGEHDANGHLGRPSLYAVRYCQAIANNAAQMPHRVEPRCERGSEHWLGVLEDGDP